MRSAEWDSIHDVSTVDLRTRARLSSLMQFYCDHGPTDMHEKMFKFLEHYAADRRQVRLEEFKAGAVRLFGFSGSHDDATAFFVTGMDVAKKQQKANRRLLNAAGAEAIRVSGLIG